MRPEGPGADATSAVIQSLSQRSQPRAGDDGYGGEPDIDPAKDELSGIEEQNKCDKCQSRAHTTDSETRGHAGEGTVSQTGGGY